MSAALDERQPGAPTTHQDASLSRPRKVRRGTRSCWECKRRKTRCIFASVGSTVCVSCQRRHTNCVGQDVAEDHTPPTTSTRNLGKRVARMEDVVKDFLASRQSVDVADPKHCSISVVEGQTRRRLNVPFSKAGLYSSPPTSDKEALLTPAYSILGQATAPSLESENSKFGHDPTAIRQLLAVLPSEDDVRLLLRESTRPTLYAILVNAQPHSKLTNEALTVTSPIPDYPTVDDNPVVLAMRMLLIAIALQSPSGEHFSCLSESRTVVSYRLATAATKSITSNDDMEGSIESLFCVILEGVFKTNCGNLRQAWFTFRRAITLAQMMGLHRTPMPTLKRLDPNFDLDPQFMWFRIVYMDRYLSLLLGLPQSTPDKSMGSTLALQHEPPLGQLERLLTVLASHVLERNENASAIARIGSTRSIDSELLHVSRKIPGNFWRPANFKGLALGSPESLMETMRLAAQVYYYGLLIHVHLPYLMRGIGDNAQHDYSRITCVNASREIMTRFITHRIFNPTSACSRPVDFYALLAAMTLLLAHLDAHQSRETANFLAHQRQSDRAILEQALERMGEISSVNKDVILEKSAKVIRQLLDIEEDAAEGSEYFVERGEDEGGKEDQDLHFHVPNLGIIRISRQGPISRNLSLPVNKPMSQSTIEELTAATSNTSLPLHSHTSPANELSTLDCMDGGLAEGYISQQQMAQVNADNDQHLGQQHQSYRQDHMISQQLMELPSMAAGVNEWAFQGVDTAFFENLMREAVDF